jgi:Ca2+/H+ antiporter
MVGWDIRATTDERESMTKNFIGRPPILGWRYVPMDPIKRDKIITFAVVIAVAVVMMVMVAVVYLQSTGDIKQESMLMMSSMLSGLMFLIIAIYMVYSYKTKASLQMYKKLRDGDFEDKDDERPKSEE